MPPSSADRQAAQQLLRGAVGEQLLVVGFGYGLFLHSGATDFPVFTIECPLTITIDGEQAWTGEPLAIEAAVRLVPLRLETVSRLFVRADGGLTLEVGPALIEVAPHRLYEAWQWRTDAGDLVVCVPGGDISL